LDGMILATGFGVGAGLFSIDPGTGSLTRLCTDVQGIDGDSNAFAVDRERKGILIHFGGPVNPKEFDNHVVALSISSEGCSAKILALSTPAIQGFLNGIAIRSAPPAVLFRRGDTNGDGKIDLTDTVRTLQYLFLGETGIPCPDSADANDDGSLDLSDAVTTLAYQFLGGTPPPDPGPLSCGSDPTLDGLPECRYDPGKCP
jgi:hypothetical protein